MRRLRRSLSDEEQESDKVIAKEGMISGTGLQGVANNAWYMDILKAKKPEFAEEIEMILEDELQLATEHRGIKEKEGGME